MSDVVRELLAGQDPSLALAIGAFVRCADREGAARFGDLAVAYREDYLELTRRERGETQDHRGELSVDEVRRHLWLSVLPRLQMSGVLAGAEHDGRFVSTFDRRFDAVSDSDVVRMDDEVWGELKLTLGSVHDDLVDLALETVRESETPSAPPVVEPTGKVLSASGLTKSYKRRKVVDNVDLEVRQGEIVGLLGPNGAGKTTTFYMIVGLVRPDAGRIFVDGKNISNQPMYKRARAGIGYLAQEPSIFRKLTVEDNVRAILQTLPLSGEARRERLEELLEELSIKHLRNVRALKLSGGERRRLEITRALVTKPRFMLLDEPFAGVDPIATNDIQTIVAGLRRRNIGVLITDHSVEQTLDIVDRAYIMFEGSVQVSGTVRELVFDDRVADLYFGPTLTARLRERLGATA